MATTRAPRRGRSGAGAHATRGAGTLCWWCPASGSRSASRSRCRRGETRADADGGVSRHRRRGASTSRDTAPNFRVVSVICDRVPLTRGHHASVHSRSHTFAHSRLFAKAVLTGCVQTRDTTANT